MFKKNKKIKQLLQAQMIIKGTQNYENFWKWRSNLTVTTQAAYNRLLLAATLLVINL